MALPVFALDDFPVGYVILELPYSSSSDLQAGADGFFSIAAQLDTSNYVGDGPKIYNPDSSPQNSISYLWICKAEDKYISEANICVDASDDTLKPPAGATVHMAYDHDESNTTNEQFIFTAQLPEGAVLNKRPQSSSDLVQDDDNLSGRLRRIARATYVCPGRPPYPTSAPTACTT